MFLITVGCVVMIMGVAGAVIPGAKDPTDAEMVRSFELHEADFNRLVAMSDRDSDVSRVAHDFTRGANLSEARWDAYKKLCDRVGLDYAGLTREPQDQAAIVYLSVNSTGIVNRGSTKGFAYCLQPLTPTVASLDENPRGPDRRHGHLYRPLRDHWYLFYDW